MTMRDVHTYVPDSEHSLKESLQALELEANPSVISNNPAA